MVYGGFLGPNDRPIGSSKIPLSFGEGNGGARPQEGFVKRNLRPNRRILSRYYLPGRKDLFRIRKGRLF